MVDRIVMDTLTSIIPLEFLVVPFCSVTDDTVVFKLHLPRQDVRAALKQMKAIDLVHSQKREFQIPVSESSTRTRRVTAEYWFVDYRSFIDIVKYKVHKIRKQIADKVAEEKSSQLLYRCPRCGTEYPVLEVVDLLDYATGSFLCKRPINRKQLCQGVLEEEDVSGRKAQLENLKDRFESELRPLLEKIAQLDEVEIPIQPPPETENMLPKDVIGGATRADGRTNNEDDMDLVIEIEDNEAGNLNSIENKGAPQQPKWFLDEPQSAVQDEEDKENEDRDTSHVDAAPTLYHSMANVVSGPAAEGTTQPGNEPEDDAVHGGEEPLITIGSEKVPLSQVTNDQSAKMTLEEYEAYAEQYKLFYES
ncbi:hypothetical protein NDN08_007874 [Rhodosorus marinus]|uniref:Transcription initiation factor IIE subunit alpha N-terminal domain-containing protein n=1 Tax=Rhodosorus marinus TaxID=101924 RepID=A0AAV8UZ49_9RHOD|nr:hypothetical protein NDN08_007874 [Rhodosorus marinus]